MSLRPISHRGQSRVTPAEALHRLHAIAAERRLLDTEADALLAILEGRLQGARPPPALEVERESDEDRLVDTSVAMRISGRSSSWLYATARRFPESRIAWQLPSNSWVWSPHGIRAFMSGRRAAREESENHEKRDDENLPILLALDDDGRERNSTE